MAMGNVQRLENFEQHEKKASFFGKSNGRNRGVKVSAGKDTKRNEEHSGENLYHLRKFLNHQKQWLAEIWVLKVLL